MEVEDYFWYGAGLLSIFLAFVFLIKNWDQSYLFNAVAIVFCVQVIAQGIYLLYFTYIIRLPVNKPYLLHFTLASLVIIFYGTYGMHKAWTIKAKP